MRLSFAFALCLFVVGTCRLWAERGESDSCIVAELKQMGVKFTDNNSVVLLESGAEKFNDLFAAISQAKSSIHLEYFNFRNDSIANRLFDLLAEKAAQGVEVRALFDGFGNDSNNKPLTRKHLRALRERGIEIYEFDPVRFPWINHVFTRDHRKIVVIDGIVGYTGGMNVADYYITGKPAIGQWRDLHLRVTGKTVGELQAIFLRLWNKVSGQNIHGARYYPGEKNTNEHFTRLSADSTATAGRKLIGVVNREPRTSPTVIRETFVRAIDCARHTIQIVNPYFTLNEAIKRALIRAVHRGVDVQVMVSTRSDIPITPEIVDYIVHKLMRQGIKVYYYQGGFHHTKLMMIDGSFSFLGSANLNSRSLRYDYECNLLICDKALTRQLQTTYEYDKRVHCFLLTETVWRQRPRFKRFVGWLFHFLTPFVQRPTAPRDALLPEPLLC